MAADIPVFQIVSRFALAFAVMASALFSTAGTIAWPEAWVYIALQMSASGAMVFWLARHDPALLETRMTLFRPAARSWDRLFMVIVIALFIPYLLLPGLDAVRIGWSSVPVAVELVGFAGVLWSMWLIFRVLQVNSFASPAVEVQKDRNHRVIDCGPYAHVRHPMYSAFIAFIYCLPLALGSCWTLLFSLPLTICFVVRIFPEECMLHDELPGYTDYSERVRYRLVPGLW